MSGSRVSARNTKGKSKLPVLHEVCVGARLSDLLQWAWSSHADTHMFLQGFGVSSDEDQDLSGDDGELFHSIRACTTMLL